MGVKKEASFTVGPTSTGKTFLLVGDRTINCKDHCPPYSQGFSVPAEVYGVSANSRNNTVHACQEPTAPFQFKRERDAGDYMRLTRSKSDLRACRHHNTASGIEIKVED